MDFEGQVGAGKAGVSDGTQAPVRLGKTGEVIVLEAHPRFYEQASRGNVWIASVGTAGVAHGTAYGTTAPISLWNPTGSGVMCVVRRFVLGYVSGTLGLGNISYGQTPQGATIPAGTELAPVCGLIGKTTKPSCRAFTGTNAVTTAPTHVMAGISYGAFVGGAGNVNPPLVDEIEGSLVVLPGNAIVAQGIGTAGTTPLVVPGFWWSEIPIT